MTAMALRVSGAERPTWRGIARCVGCVAVLLIAATSVAALQATLHVSDAAVLRTSFLGALAARDWQAAIAAGLELERATGGWWQDRYNLACAYERAGEREAALNWLTQSVAAGLHRVRTIDEDGDLAALRKDPRFVAIRAAVVRNWNAYAVEVRSRFHETPPIVVLPKGYDATRPAPLLIALHGHGGRADGWPVQWREVTERMGVVLAVPQSIHSLGAGFTWGGPDEAELIVDLTLERVRSEVAIDPSLIVLTGFSQGGYMAWAIGLRHPERFVAVIPMAGGFLEGVDVVPPAPVEGAPRYLFMVGSHDRGIGQTRQAAKAFAAAGYRTELRIYRSTGHSFPMALVPELKRALRFALGTTS